MGSYCCSVAQLCLTFCDPMDHTTQALLTIWNFVSKMMSLLFNTLLRFIIAFLPNSKHFSISWLQPPSTVILEHKKMKAVTISIFSPSV